MILKKILCVIGFIVSAVILTSCATINAIVPPSTDLTFNVSEDINPDKSGRASPVVVKVFELSSRTIFVLCMSHLKRS